MRTYANNNVGKRSLLHGVALDLLEGNKGEPSFDKYHRISNLRGYYVLSDGEKQPPINNFAFGFKDGLLSKAREMTGIHRHPTLDLISKSSTTALKA